MSKQIDYGQEAFKKLIAGAEKLNNAVVVTMGAKGQNVLIEDTYGNDPQITKDGVTVAKSVYLKDPVEKLACNLIKKVALRTNDAVGDGTTTSVCLANAILKYGTVAINEGFNPVMLKRGIDIELQHTLAYLDEIKTPLNDDMDMAYQVALVSANGDKDVAQLITDVYSLVGKEGNVAIEQDFNSPKSSYKKVEGFEFDRGFNNPYYITDIPTETVNYKDAIILISDYRISSIYEVKNVLELCQTLGKPLVLICEDLDPDADNQIALNRLHNGLPVVTINAPEFGDRRLEFLEDLAVMTGGSFISTVTGKTYDDVTEADFGKADKVVVTRNTTSIIGGKGQSNLIQERLNSIVAKAENTKEEEYKKYLLKRHAKFQGGVVVIKVGGYSEVERNEIKDRVEDAVNSVKSALLDGIIPGGGSALLRVSMTPLIQSEDERKDVIRGREVLKSALKIPFNQILINAGITEVKELGETLFSSHPDMVFDVLDENFTDGIENGIIDPVLVTKTALTNAASIAGTILTTGCTISFEVDNGDQTLKL